MLYTILWLSMDYHVFILSRVREAVDGEWRQVTQCGTASP